MKKYTLTIALLWSIVLIQSCFSEESLENENPIVYREALSTFDKTCKTAHNLGNIVTKHGNYLDYEILNDSFILICWGNEEVDRMMEDTFYCIGSTNWIPEYIDDSKDFINLFYSCGMPCWGNYILPLDEEDSVLSYTEPMALDISMNRVVFVGINELLRTNTTADKNIIFVEDFKQKKQMKIHLKYPCNRGVMHSCLKEVRLTKTHLYYKWETYDGEKEEGKVRLEF